MEREKKRKEVKAKAELKAEEKVLAETDMSAEDIARKSIKVASDICVFTNNNITVEKV